APSPSSVEAGRRETQHAGGPFGERSISFGSENTRLPIPVLHRSEIKISICVVIAPCRAVQRSGLSQPGRDGDICKGTVPVIAIEAAGGSRRVRRSADQQAQPPIVVQVGA